MGYRPEDLKLLQTENRGRFKEEGQAEALVLLLAGVLPDAAAAPFQCPRAQCIVNLVQITGKGN